MKRIEVSKTSSKGIVMGKVFLAEEQDLSPEERVIEAGQADTETAAYEHAVEEVIADLEPLAEKSDIFAGHLELAKDIALKEGVLNRIQTQACCAQKALHETAEEFRMIFEMMEDEYMRERAADIQDIRNRLMRKLKGIGDGDFDSITEQVILVAKDLAPSDTAKLNLEYILGFITELGGVTSHVSIMARGMGIPALVGVEGVMSEVCPGDFVIMDASVGVIIVNPEPEVIEEYKKKVEEFDRYQKELEESSSLPTVTVDGRKLEVCGNVGSLEDVKNAVKYQIDGIGLFRSEFLYMESDHFPTEEEQFDVYRQAAELLGERELTIRTLDIGGDKGLDYFEFPKEENPFLGYRAIRIGLDQKEILKTQLRALLRAGTYGHIRIMFPMIISIEEVVEAYAVLEECKDELHKEGIPFQEEIEAGVMIETPAAVMMAEELAEKVDFFSIGTNDLTQYFLAVDRGNQKIAAMYNSYHPAVLRAIYKTIQAGHKYNRKVGMCGEFASDIKAVKMLLGMGLDEFSVSPQEAAGVKYQIRNASCEQAQKLAEEVMKQPVIDSVMRLLEESV